MVLKVWARAFVQRSSRFRHGRPSFSARIVIGRRMARLQAHLLSFAVLTSACGTDEDSVIEPGILEYFGQPAVIDVPSSAAVGELIAVNVVTYGDGCFSSERTEVVVDGERADVAPFDRRRISDQAPCPLILLELSHGMSMTFDTPGPKTIRVHGRRVDADADEVIEIQRAVAVQ
jgi:hypothetical protein